MGSVPMGEIHRARAAAGEGTAAARASAAAGPRLALPGASAAPRSRHCSPPCTRGKGDADKRGPLVGEKGGELIDRALDDMWSSVNSKATAVQVQPNSLLFSHTYFFTTHNSFFKSHSSIKHTLKHTKICFS